MLIMDVLKEKYIRINKYKKELEEYLIDPFHKMN